LFAYTYDNKHITIRQNPMRDVKYSVDDEDGRDDFTPDPTSTVLRKMVGEIRGIARGATGRTVMWC